MKSIPAAMTWELLARERWGLATGALFALALPVFILTALKGQGGVPADDPSMLVMHFVMVQVNIAAFGWALIAAGWKISPLFPLPITSATLAAWRLLPAMAFMAIETVVWTAALNGLFGLEWPYAGPAFLSAVAVAAVLVALWLTTGSRWGIFAVTVVAAVLGFWFKSRYGPTIDEPQHYWSSVTLVEGLTLAVFAAIAYALAILGVKRSRRGERPFTLGIVDWLDRVLELKRSPLRPAATPAQAQFWYAWRYGWFMPIAVALGVLFGLTVWFVASRDLDALVREFPGTSFLVAGISFLGVLAFANLGASDGLVMGSFLAARPIATADIARATLRAAAISLLGAWVVWFAALALVFSVAYVADSLSAWPADQLGRTLGTAMLMSWLNLGVFLSFAITGRTRFLFRLFCGVALAYLSVVLTSKYALPPLAHAAVMEGLVAVIAMACIITTVWVYAAAMRRGLISAATVWTAAVLCGALFTGVMLLFSLQNGSFLLNAVVAAVCAAAAAPLAAAPLALTYNRVR